MSNRDDRLADSLDALTASIGHLVTESRIQRTQLQRVSAALGIEIEDREELGKAHGLKLVQHEREINRLKQAHGSPDAE